MINKREKLYLSSNNSLSLAYGYLFDDLDIAIKVCHHLLTIYIILSFAYSLFRMLIFRVLNVDIYIFRLITW